MGTGRTQLRELSDCAGLPYIRACVCLYQRKCHARREYLPHLFKMELCIFGLDYFLFLINSMSKCMYSIKINRILILFKLLIAVF